MNGSFDLAAFGDLAHEQWNVPTARLAAGARLRDDLHLDAMQVAVLVGVIEDAFDISFPEDLLEALRIVDDVVYYTNVKVEQRLSAVRS